MDKNTNDINRTQQHDTEAVTENEPDKIIEPDKAVSDEIVPTEEPNEEPPLEESNNQMVMVKKKGGLDKKIKILIVGLAGIVVLVLAISLYNWVVNGRTYSEAEELFEAKQYTEAVNTLKPLVEKDYKDSKKFTKYIKAIDKLEKAEMKALASFERDAFDEVEVTLESLNGFKKSKEYKAYANAAKDLANSGNMQYSEHPSYGKSFEAAGDVNGANHLAAFFNNLAVKKYDDAIASAKAYQGAGGKLLTPSKISIITSANKRYDDKLSDKDTVNLMLGMMYVEHNLIPNSFKSLKKGYSWDTIKSFKLKGLAKKPNGKVLVMTKTKPYKESAEYKVNYSYTALLGKNRFPTNIAEVQYVIRVYEKDTFKDWYRGGGKKVPGVSQSVYAEIYNPKTKKIVAKTKTKFGPKLQKQYSYSGTIPDIIKPDWNNVDKAKKKLVIQLKKKLQ